MKFVDIPNDNDLTALLAEGDRYAFTLIYERYWDKLLAIAYTHTISKSEAEEIVQEVFLKLWERRTDVTIQSLENYLSKAVRYATLKAVYRSRRHQDIQSSISITDHYLSEDQIYATFLKEYLDGLIEKLPARCQLIFKRSRENHKTNQEIACELGISEKSVEANITRALKKLRFEIKRTWFLILVFLPIF